MLCDKSGGWVQHQVYLVSCYVLLGQLHPLRPRRNVALDVNGFHCWQRPHHRHLQLKRGAIRSAGQDYLSKLFPINVFVSILILQVNFIASDHVAMWRDMEAAFAAGKARSIGISNFSSEQSEALAKMAKVPIAANQVELHAYFQQKNLRQTMDRLGIKVMAYAPLGSPGE